MASLVIDKISKSFGRTRVLDELSFEVGDGEFCVLLGPSGCGKSTLLRIIAGLERANDGAVCIDGMPVYNLPPRERDVAFVFQNYALYPHMTVFDNLAFSLRLRGIARDEIQSRVTEVARLLEIENQLQQKPQQLSGGQRQRVALGRAIVRQPKIFLFDEPLSNLDATLRASMRVELARLHQRLGATMLYVTHDQAEAMTLGEKIIVLHQGEIKQIGTPQDIYHRPANRFVASFVGNPRMNLIDGKVEGDGMTFGSDPLSLDLVKLFPAIAALGRGEEVTLGVRPENLSVGEASQALFHGVVELVEDMGADRFAHILCNGLRLIARLNEAPKLQKGDAVDLTAEAKSLHLFYRGARLDGALRGV